MLSIRSVQRTCGDAAGDMTDWAMRVVAGFIGKVNSDGHDRWNLRSKLVDERELSVQIDLFVCLQTCTHFVPAIVNQPIAELIRVTKPGSTVAAAVWDVRGGFVASRMFFDTAAALDPTAGKRRARNYTRPMTRPGGLANAWLAAGFVDVVGTSIPVRMKFSTSRDYWAPYEAQSEPVGKR